jgi:hypothetical protein
MLVCFSFSPFPVIVSPETILWGEVFVAVNPLDVLARDVVVRLCPVSEVLVIFPLFTDRDSTSTEKMKLPMPTALALRSHGVPSVVERRSAFTMGQCFAMPTSFALTGVDVSGDSFLNGPTFTSS